MSRILPRILQGQEGATQAKAQRHKNAGPVSSLVWLAYGVSANRKLAENEARHEQVPDWEELWMLSYFRVWTWSYEPAVPKPG